MAKRDKRVSILGGDLDKDIKSPNALSRLIDPNYQRSLLDSKIELLFRHYKINLDNHEEAVWALVHCLTKDCVKGFKVVDKLNPRHRPKKLHDRDWLDLAHNISNRLAAQTARSRVEACQHIIKERGSRWSAYKAASLDAALRKQIAEAKKLATGNEVDCFKAGHLFETIDQLATVLD